MLVIIYEEMLLDGVLRCSLNHRAVPSLPPLHPWHIEECTSKLEMDVRQKLSGRTPCWFGSRQIMDALCQLNALWMTEPFPCTGCQRWVTNFRPASHTKKPPEFCQMSSTLCMSLSAVSRLHPCDSQWCWEHGARLCSRPGRGQRGGVVHAVTVQLQHHLGQPEWNALHSTGPES